MDPYASYHSNPYLHQLGARGTTQPSRTKTHAEKTEDLKSARRQAKYWAERVEKLRDECIEENVKSVDALDNTLDTTS